MLAGLLGLHPSVCGAQAIGSAASIKNQVEGIHGGQSQSLSSGSSVYSNELIRSGEASVAELVFVDKTKLSVGPKSEVRLDKFVYDPNKGAGKVVIEASRGAYRFVTGVQDHRNYEIKTPYASIGVRGTVFEANLEHAQARAGTPDPPLFLKAPSVDRRCRNYEKIKLVSGEILVKTTSGKSITVNEPDTVVTVCSDGSFQTSMQNESILDFIPEDVAVVPGPELALLAALAGVGALTFGKHKNQPPKPVSPH
jgi:hypothetical protein